MSDIMNMPNVLTIARVLLIPFIVLSFFMQSKTGNTIVLLTFVLCCITDFLDGYFARIYKKTTKFGQMLDPVADKALIATTILFIVGFQKISILSMIPACIILCREVMISEIRDIVSMGDKPFITSNVSKWKTAVQMLSISLLLFAATIDSENAKMIGEILLWASAVISIYSGISYCLKHFDSLV